MFLLENRTPFAASGALQIDPQGHEHWLVMVKASFDVVRGECRLSEPQEPVLTTPVYRGEPGASSLRYDSDLVLEKRSTDVLLNGHAYAPGGRPAECVDVVLYIERHLQMRVRVHGDRIWQAGFRGVKPGAPTPFLQKPLSYEYAFGGTALMPEGQRAPYPFNPVGVGFARDPENQIGKPVPNLEDPDRPLNRWRPEYPVLGLGAVDRGWEPRRQHVGTCDAAWRRERFPLLPLDFDPRFFQSAPPERILSRPLLGGEQITLQQMTPEGHLSFALPLISLGCETWIGLERVSARLMLDTVYLEPDIPRILLVWRAAVPVHGRRFEVQRTRIFQKELIEKGRRAG